MTATKNFRVDSFIIGLALKSPCRAHTIAPITLSGIQTINGHVGAANDRIMVKDQADPVENGIYTQQSSAWQRDGDFDGSRDVVGGTLVSCWDGNSIVLFSVDGEPAPLTPGEDAFTFTFFMDPGQSITNIEMNDNSINNVELGPFVVRHQAFTVGTGTVTWDYDAGQSAYLDLTGNVTSLLFSNLKATGSLSELEIELEQDISVAYTFAWPAAVEWVNGDAPDLSELGSKWLVHLRSWDGGITWLGTFTGPFS